MIERCAEMFVEEFFGEESLLERFICNTVGGSG